MGVCFLLILILRLDLRVSKHANYHHETAPISFSNHSLRFHHADTHSVVNADESHSVSVDLPFLSSEFLLALMDSCVWIIKQIN